MAKNGAAKIVLSREELGGRSAELRLLPDIRTALET